LWADFDKAASLNVDSYGLMYSDECERIILDCNREAVATYLNDSEEKFPCVRRLNLPFDYPIVCSGSLPMVSRLRFQGLRTDTVAIPIHMRGSDIFSHDLSM
jgi:hypothetical protein